MVACRLLVCSFIGHIPTYPKAFVTNVYSLLTYSTFLSDILSIYQSTPWWKPSITFSISYVTTQLLIL